MWTTYLFDLHQTPTHTHTPHIHESVTRFALHGFAHFQTAPSVRACSGPTIRSTNTTFPFAMLHIMLHHSGMQFCIAPEFAIEAISLQCIIFYDLIGGSAAHRAQRAQRVPRTVGDLLQVVADKVLASHISACVRVCVCSPLLLCQRINNCSQPWALVCQCRCWP